MNRSICSKNISFVLRGPTSGVTVSEYFEMMLASIEKYLLSGIARIAKMVYDMARGFGGNEALRDKLIDVMYENEQ